MGTAFFAVRKRKTGKQPGGKEKKNVQIVPTRKFDFFPFTRECLSLPLDEKESKEKEGSRRRASENRREKGRMQTC